jgi:drug/metabolite transporter (DMT)-like permease
MKENNLIYIFMEITTTKPKKVAYALWILITSILVGIISSIIKNVSSDVQQDMAIQTIVIMVVTLMITILIIYKINERKKWAREVFLILFGLGVISYAFTFNQIFQASIFTGIVSILQTILQLSALILLYSKESNEWFNKK